MKDGQIHSQTRAKAGKEAIEKFALGAECGRDGDRENSMRMKAEDVIFVRAQVARLDQIDRKVGLSPLPEAPSSRWLPLATTFVARVALFRKENNQLVKNEGCGPGRTRGLLSEQVLSLARAEKKSGQHLPKKMKTK